MKVRTRFTINKQVEDNPPKVLLKGSIVEWDGQVAEYQNVLNADYATNVRVSVTAADGEEYLVGTVDLELVDAVPKLEQKFEIHGSVDPKLLEENAADELSKRLDWLAKEQDQNPEREDADKGIWEFAGEIADDLDSLEARFDEFLSGKSFKVYQDEDGNSYLRGIASSPKDKIYKLTENTDPYLKAGDVTITGHGLAVSGEIDSSYKIPAKDLRLGMKIKLDIGQKEPYTVTSLETGWANTLNIGYNDLNGYLDSTTKDFDFMVTVV